MEEQLICKELDCQRSFVITPGFKKLMEENPNIAPPKRCGSCRQKRRREQPQE